MTQAHKMAPPDIPRSAWPLHPNWPAHALLVQSHANFRLVSARLKTEVRSPRTVPAAARLFRRWMYAMSNHEHYEESKLYPYLEKRWGVSMLGLVEGHEGLHSQRAEVFAAFDALDAQDALDPKAEERARVRIRGAIDGYDARLLAHLDLEEQTVVPLLLELSPTEFADYTLLPVHTLLAKLDWPAEQITKG